MRIDEILGEENGLLSFWVRRDLHQSQQQGLFTLRTTNNAFTSLSAPWTHCRSANCLLKVKLQQRRQSCVRTMKAINYFTLWPSFKQALADTVCHHQRLRTKCFTGPCQVTTKWPSFWKIICIPQYIAILIYAALFMSPSSLFGVFFWNEPEHLSETRNKERHLCKTSLRNNTFQPRSHLEVLYRPSGG